MSDDSIAARVRAARNANYDPAPFVARLKQLLSERNLSERRAGLESGLDHQSVRRMMIGQRPDMVRCILLADYLEVNPNELLALTGWPRLKVFDIATETAKNLPVEVVEVARRLAQLPNPYQRQKVAAAILALLEQYFA